MALVDHLRELRLRLGISALAVVVASVVVFVLWEPVFEFLRQPYCSTDAAQEAARRAGGDASACDLASVGVFDQFKTRLRVAVLGGAVLAAPVWLYQIGAFITPALHRHEKKYAAGFLGASLVLFGCGTVLAYLTIAQGLDFLLNVGGTGVYTITSVQSYLSFVTLCLLAFGFAFMFPVVVTFLNLLGAFPLATMTRVRRYMFVGIFAASAVITPSQDPFTFVFMAVPICVLYEGCILIARVRERAARRRRASDPVAALGDDETSALDLSPSPLDEDRTTSGT